MPAFTQSLVAICPAELRDAAHQLGAGLGWTGDNFSVPLSADGEPPATHYGLHATVTDGAAEILIGKISVIVGDKSMADVESVRSKLIVSARSDVTGRAHFMEVIDAAGLKLVSDA